MPEPVRCTHIHPDDRPCGSPALRGETLCYQHHPTARPARTPRVSLAPPVLPDPADLPAVQRGLAELLRLTAAGLVDAPHAKRLLAILAEAGKNLARLDRQADRLDRQAARARTLDLRQRALALAETRIAARHPQPAPAPGIATQQSGHPTEPASAPTCTCRHPERSEGPRQSPPHHNPAPFQPGTPQPPVQPVDTPARTAELEAAREAEAQAAFDHRRQQERQQEHDRRLAQREATRARLTPELRRRYDAARAAATQTHPPLTPIEC